MYHFFSKHTKQGACIYIKVSGIAYFFSVKKTSEVYPNVLFHFFDEILYFKNVSPYIGRLEIISHPFNRVNLSNSTKKNSAYADAKERRG